MDRLLTKEEMALAGLGLLEDALKGKIRDITNDKAQVLLCERIAQTQRKLTRKLTLKEVGEWLNNALGDNAPDQNILNAIADFAESCKRGELPR